MDKLQKELKKIKTYYVNDFYTEKNFPQPEKLRTKNVKVIEMSQSFSSKEALAEMKRQGCTPMNVWELVKWVQDGNAEKGKWYMAVDEKDKLLYANGYHRVPYVGAYSDGDFEFNLGDFEDDWPADDCLVCFCDSPLGSRSLSEVKSSDTLTLDRAIGIVKMAGYKVIKET